MLPTSTRLDCASVALKKDTTAAAAMTVVTIRSALSPRLVGLVSFMATAHIAAPLALNYRRIANVVETPLRTILSRLTPGARWRQYSGQFDDRLGRPGLEPVYFDPITRASGADGLSYRKISAVLATRGHATGSGKPHVASAIQKMLG